MEPYLKDEKDNQLEMKFKSSPTSMDIGLKFVSPRFSLFSAELIR